MTMALGTFSDSNPQGVRHLDATACPYGRGMDQPAFQLTMDCADPRVVATFWKAALGYVDAPAPEGFDGRLAWLTAMEVPREEWDDGLAIVDPRGTAPGISMLKVHEAKLVKNRLHLDLPVSGGRAVPAGTREPRMRAEVQRLVVLGARVLTEHDAGHTLDHVVLADPEGNEFCVV